MKDPFVFCDRGAWHGFTCDVAPGGETTVFVVSLVDSERFRLQVSPRLEEVEVNDDCLVLQLEGDARAIVRYDDVRRTTIRCGAGIEIAMETEGPFDCRRGDDGFVLEYLEGPEGPGEDLEGIPRTLRFNWRVAHGDILSGGAVPSPFAYPGFWAWDSWKHAAVLPTRLARQQIEAMFRHQREDGMVPDTSFFDARQNNWRCTKPPLAAWACSQHVGLLEEFREPLLRYHEWWMHNRKPPGEDLFAYGGNDHEASCWESGWDNSTRFDDVVMRDGLQSVLSVDLNAYLCLEKRLLGRPDPEMERRVCEVFFHDGVFKDVTWPEHRPVETLTAATWIPLFCGIAPEEQARSVIEKMLDERHFWTPLPFPTVARSDPRFDEHGYWRGPVWMDHAAWAVEALDRYGFRNEAIRAARSLLAAPPDWECYSALSGEPARGERPAVPQFSWTAAARHTLSCWLDKRGGVRENPRPHPLD